MEKNSGNQAISEHSLNQSAFAWKIVHVIARVLSRGLFRLKVTHNELEGVQGPCVVIANHQCMLDFVNLATAISRPMRVVISDSFYRTIPFPKLLHKLNPIPKQQFELDIQALKEMLGAVRQGQLLAIYPAGLMCEDGLSTPIPHATGKFLRHMDCDIYVARTRGSYFVQPKWGKGFHPGKTTLEIYRLLTAQEMRSLSAAEIHSRVNQALLFDAYAEQEQLMVPYQGGDDLRGLENVLYRCPHCEKEFTIEVPQWNHIRCSSCGYEEVSDRYGFLHRISGFGKEFRHVSDWSSWIQQETEAFLRNHPQYVFMESVQVQLIDSRRRKYVPVGQGQLRFCENRLTLEGTVCGEPSAISLSTDSVPMLPFVPGKQLELQYQNRSYRCVLENGQKTIKFISLIKASHRLSRKEKKQEEINRV